MKLVKLTWTERRPKSSTKITTKQEFAYYKDLASAKRAKYDLALSANVIGEVKIEEGVNNMRQCNFCNDEARAAVWWLGRVFCSMAHAETWREQNPDATPQVAFNTKADHAGKWASIAKATGFGMDGTPPRFL